MDLEILAQADKAALKLELAKQAIEAAKSEFEACKKAYDEVMAKADEQGISKAKLKKLTEERIQALFDSGMIDRTEEPASKRKSKPKVKKVATGEAEVSNDEELDFSEISSAPANSVEAHNDSRHGY